MDDQLPMIKPASQPETARATNAASPPLAVVAARAADAKLGTSTVVLEVGPILAIVDTFVITSATNPRQVRTITEEVEGAIRAAGGGGPLRVEGIRDARWVLMDYGHLVVHVFLEEARAYYSLERLWADAPRLAWEDESVSGVRTVAGPEARATAFS